MPALFDNRASWICLGSILGLAEACQQPHVVSYQFRQCMVGQHAENVKKVHFGGGGESDGEGGGGVKGVVGSDGVGADDVLPTPPTLSPPRQQSPSAADDLRIETFPEPGYTRDPQLELAGWTLVALRHVTTWPDLHMAGPT